MLDQNRITIEQWLITLKEPLRTLAIDDSRRLGIKNWIALSLSDAINQIKEWVLSSNRHSGYMEKPRLWKGIAAFFDGLKEEDNPESETDKLIPRNWLEGFMLAKSCQPTKTNQ